jgi:hypothetical protein
MKNSNDTIGNRTRDLQACSAVINQLRHRVTNGEASNYQCEKIDGLLRYFHKHDA